MTGIDTGFLVGLVDPRDALRSRASGWAQALQGEATVVTNHVVIEAYGFFTRPDVRRRADLILQAVLDQPEVELIMVDATLHQAGLWLFRDRCDKAWSLTDCVSFVFMERRGVRRALAYDHHFEQAGFEPLLRREPV